MVTKLQYTVTTIILIMIWGCAQVVAPTGGERDITPPEVIKSKPVNESLNFSEKKIILDFDEFIVLKNLKDQLIVSPPLKYPLKSKTKGKSIELQIEDTLKSNTTYVFNFGNAIVDLNENNPISGFQYVFSTGDNIDSLTLSGKIVDAFTLSVEKDFLVMLYPEFTSDSVPSKELPIYVGRSDEEGNFTITNIKAGDYQLFGLLDQNSNYLYDRPDEKVSFWNELISIQGAVDPLRLNSFLKKDNQQFIEEQKLENAKLELSFKFAPEEVNITLLDTSISNLILEKEQIENKLTLWLKEIDNQKLRMEVITDNFIDTIKIKTDTISSNATFEMLGSLGGIKNYFEPILLEFNRPIQYIEMDSILLINSDSVNVPFSIQRDSASNKKVLVSIERKSEEEEYFMTILPNAFVDIYNQTIDTLAGGIGFNQAEDFGNLDIRLQVENSSPKIIQLTNPKGEMLQELKVNDTIATFKHLVPGDYRLKLIFDDNGNGEWDTGDFYQNLQPERIILFDENISMRKNWDKEIDWILSDQ